MFYNATGADLTYQYAFDWHGHIGSRPYPQTIKNGQCVCVRAHELQPHMGSFKVMSVALEIVALAILSYPLFNE